MWCLISCDGFYGGGGDGEYFGVVFDDGVCGCVVVCVWCCVMWVLMCIWVVGVW